MCGIVGILGRASVANPMMEALRRLEYRGYESAGIATLDGGQLPASVAPMEVAIPFQLLACHTSIALGRNVDQPRNLARSVTVE